MFNTRFITTDNPTSPLIITQVYYGSTETRIQWLKDRLAKWCTICKTTPIPDDTLYIAAYQLFQTIKFFALKAKHDGFREEREWRIIYMPERDPKKEMLNAHYVVGPRGVEPKLILKIHPLIQTHTWKFADILDRIILGPSLSSFLARRSIERMLEAIGKPEFQQKVSASQIPLRPTN